MRVIHKDIKRGHGIVKAKVENLNDLWYLNLLIDKNDLIKAQTTRKIKVGEKEEPIKRAVTVTIKAENIEFHEYQNILRISGKIVEAPEDIPRGSYHTITIDEDTVLTMEKEHWTSYHIKKLEESMQPKQPNILIVVFDREEAIFALSKTSGYEILTRLHGQVEKKALKTVIKGSFYEEIIKLLEEHVLRENLQNIIIASPAFWKEELMKHVKDESLRKRIALATCSSVSENAISEVLKRPEIKEVLKQDRTSKELQLVEQLYAEISKDGSVSYGSKEVKQAVDSGAAEVLAISDNFAHKNRSDKDFISMLVSAEETKARIFFLRSEEAVKKLDSLGGVAAILRYKMSY